MWEMRFMKALLKLKSVRLVRWDACRTDSPHKKPTGILTNAPWIVDLLCDMKERPHVHVPLEGKVVDYRPGASQELVWYTSLAAEYTEGMCNKLAKDFEGHLKQNGHQKVPPVPGAADEAPPDQSLKDLMDQFAGFTVAQPQLEKKAQLLTKKQVTEKENRACAGGLRDPAAFVRSSEKARTAGARLRRCLDDVLRQPDVLEGMLGVVEALGTETCAVPEAAVTKARQALCLEYGIALDEGLGQGSCEDERSRRFSNPRKKLPAQSAYS